MTAMIGHIEQGQVRLAQPFAGSEGQAVLVIPLPMSDPTTAQPLLPPPEQLMEEDANEFRRRPETLSALNRGELA